MFIPVCPLGLKETITYVYLTQVIKVGIKWYFVSDDTQVLIQSI